MASTLSAHAGARYVERADLAALAAPGALGPRHRPVPHLALVETLQEVAQAHALTVTKERLALQRDDSTIFGVFDFTRVGAGGDFCLSLGFRGSNDRQMALQMVCGARVFVCDNLAFSGDMIAMTRKHTTRLDLRAEISDGMGRYLQHATRLESQIDRLRGQALTDVAARDTICRVFEARALPTRVFRTVIDNYFRPTTEATDCAPRSAWGLHNACTRAVKGLNAKPAFEATIALGRLFGIGTEN